MNAEIVITGGGTGGHVFPALAIAEELKTRGYRILYVGSDRGLEARLAPQKGIPFLPIRTGPVKNQNVLQIVKTVFQLAGAVFWSIRLLLKTRASAIVGVGGYISVPMCVAGFVLRRPVFLQEQNVSVGIANRFLGRLSRKVFLGFPEAARYFKKDKCVPTGNPIRKEFFLPATPYQPNGKALLILGGSQGSRAINQVILGHLENLPQDLDIIHQTGGKDLESVRAGYARGYRGNVEVCAFIENIAETIAKATVVVSRSGALTVSELVQIGRPSILIPFPRQGQNDQTDNARWLANAGAALVVEQGQGFDDRFRSAWTEIFRPDVLSEMAACFSTLRRPPALVTICDLIEEALR